jgi:hypothetical protein
VLLVDRRRDSATHQRLIVDTENADPFPVTHTSSPFRAGRWLSYLDAAQLLEDDVERPPA